MPPDFSRADYWSDRFDREQDGFEWLSSTDPAFEDCIEDAIHKSAGGKPQILHIGPGSSKISLWLRERVADPAQVLNVDFAQSAIELGSRWERERWPASDVSMRWQTADLLKFADVETLPQSAVASASKHFDLIVDKSTTDAVSCGDEVSPNGSAIARIKYHNPGVSDEELDHSLHPELLLALNLACIVPAGSLWICLSYNAQRFLAISDRQAGRRKPSAPPIEDLACSLWVIEKKTEMDVERATAGKASIVHRPKITNYLYLLRRTNVAL